MPINFNLQWNIVESINVTPTISNPTLLINVGAGGYDYGGTYQHTVTSKGTQLYTGSAYRSYRVSSYRFSGGTWTNISASPYDVLASTTEATNLNTFLNNMSANDLLVMTTWDEPATNKSFFDTNLRDNFGARLATNSFEYRSMYILVSAKGRRTPIYERYERRYFMGINATLWLI